jgi:hypothetical protein
VSLDGLGLPSFNQQFALSGARDGRRYEGTTFNQATLTLTVSVGDLDPVPGRRRRRNGDEWRELDRAWRKSVSPTQTGVLSIITGAGTRRIRLRLDQPTVMPLGAAVHLRVQPARLGDAGQPGRPGGVPAVVGARAVHLGRARHRRSGRHHPLLPGRR